MSSNPDAVLDILNDLGFTNISLHKGDREIRFSREEGSNPTGMRLRMDDLRYRCFSTGDKGNLYTLIMNRKILSFPESLDYVASLLGLDKSQFNRQVRLPFGGFYKRLKRELEEPETTMTIYPESILEPYLHKYNMMFFKDGINFQTQAQFKVGWDIESLRITVPEWTLDGKLCGIMGRLNDPNCEKGERWLPIIPCSRNLTLYGYHQNYEMIQSKGLVVVGESEKFVQQMHSMGSQVGLALGGCDISEVQAKYLKGLLIPKIILALDEGIDEDRVREQASRLTVNNQVMQNKVGYIWDEDHEVLPAGSKMSPTDVGKEKFAYLVKKKVRWIT